MSRVMAGVLLAAALSGCAGKVPAAVPAPDLVVVVIRHAEKADAGRNPPLSAAGQARARQLVDRLAGVPLVAVYATGLQRTQLTVQPVALAHGLPVRVYDAAEPAGTLAARLRAAHPAGTVLVAGHSNTVPAIVAALCTCTVAPMDDDEYDRMSIVRIGQDGRATLDVSRYGPAP